MASIVESIRAIFTDDNAIPKTLTYTAILFAIYWLLKDYIFAENIKINSVFDIKNYYIIFGLSVLFEGYMLKTQINTCQEKSYILASINPFPALWVSIKSIACSLLLIPEHLFKYKMEAMFDLTMPIPLVIYWIISIVLFALYVASLVLFGEKGSMLAALNLYKIAKIWGDTIIYIIIETIQLVLFNLVVSVPICGLTYMLFGKSDILAFVICFAIVINNLHITQSLAQIYFEQIKTINA